MSRRACGGWSHDGNNDVSVRFASSRGIGARCAEGALFANRQLAAINAIDVGDRWDGGTTSLAGTSLAHLGFMTKLPGNVRQGSTTYTVKRWRADEALRFTAEHRLATVAGIPPRSRSCSASRPSMRSTCRACGRSWWAAAPALVREGRERFGAPLAVRYSRTEAATGIGTSFSDPPEDAEASVGRPLPGVELAVLDPEDRPVPPAFTADGFARTGDLGRVDERGRAAPGRCTCGAATTSTSSRSRRCCRRTPTSPRWRSCALLEV